MRRKITADGLYVAFGFVLAVLGLIASILGLAMGAGDQLPRYVAIGGISLALLLGLLYLQFVPSGDRPPLESASEAPPYRRLELFWAGILVLSVAGLVLVSGPSRSAWVFLVLVGAWQLATWERRRRRGTERGS